MKGEKGKFFNLEKFFDLVGKWELNEVEEMKGMNEELRAEVDKLLGACDILI